MPWAGSGRSSDCADATFESLSAEAGTAAAGSGGLVFLPYLAGERTPIWSTAARGVFLGLSYATTRAEMLRSIMEGCAFAVLDNLRVAEATGVRVTEWLATGGAARSPVWNQIKADVTGRPLVVARRADGGEGGHGLGLFALAAEAVGLAGDAAETVERLLPRTNDLRAGCGDGMLTTWRCSRCTTSCPAGCCRHSTGCAAVSAVRAAVLEGERQLSYREVADPVPGDGEVLLEVRASAVCGSDHPPLPARAPDVSDDPRPRGGRRRVGDRARRR